MFNNTFRTEKTASVFLRCSADWAYMAIVVVLAVMSYSFPVATAAAVTVRPTSKPILAPYVQCSASVCDLRTHYCDEVIEACARCDDDCHPARISDVQSAIDECLRKCQWYYVFKSTVPSPAALSAVSQSSFAVSVLNEEQPNEQATDTTVMTITMMVILSLISVLAILSVVVMALVVCRLVRHQTGIPKITTDSSLNGQGESNTVMVTNLTNDSPGTMHVKCRETRSGSDESSTPPPTFTTTTDRSAAEPESLTLLIGHSQESR